MKRIQLSTRVSAALILVLCLSSLMVSLVKAPAPALASEGVTCWYWTSDTEINSVATGDVDGDGQNEIVTGGYYYDGTRSVAQLCVWNGATLSLEGVKTWYWIGDTFIFSVAVGDVDGDGQNEIVTGGSYQDGTRNVAQLCVWGGSTLSLENVVTWYWTSHTFISSVSIGDVNGDGAFEIVTGGSYSDGTRFRAQLAVWDSATLSLEGVRTWYWVDDTKIHSVTCEDVDDDGETEIVTGGEYFDYTRTYAQLAIWGGSTLSLEGVTVWYWVTNAHIYSVACADVDGDSAVEIVTGGSFGDGTLSRAQLCVWNGATLTLEGVKTWYWAGNTYISSVAVENVDGDTAVEIVTGGYHYDGTRLKAQLCVWGGSTLTFEVATSWYWVYSTAINRNSMIVGDVDVDGQKEILTGGYYYDMTHYWAQLVVWTKT